MKTPYLDTEIKLIEGFKDNKEASFYQLRKLAEYREIKQLLIHSVSQQRELLHKLLQNLADNDELVTDTTHDKIIQRLYICLCNCS